MIRLANVVAVSNHAVTLNLLKAENCAGCPSNCNEPLIDLFSLRKNQFSLSLNNPKYDLIDEDSLLSLPLIKNQVVLLKINSQDLFKSSGLLYLLPLVLCLTCLAMGHYCGKLLGINTDVTALLGLISGLVLVVLLTKSKLMSRYMKFRPKVTIFNNSGTKS